MIHHAIPLTSSEAVRQFSLVCGSALFLVLLVGCGSSEPSDEKDAAQPITLLDGGETDARVTAGVLEAMAQGSFEEFRKIYRENYRSVGSYLREFVSRYPELAAKRLADYAKEEGISNPTNIFDVLVKADSHIAFEFATLGFQTAHRGQPQMQAINEMITSGDLDAAVERSTKVGSIRHRLGVIGSIAARLKEGDLDRYSEWIEPMMSEEKEAFVQGLQQSEEWPTFEELETWSLRDALEPAVRPILLGSMERDLSELRSAKELQAGFDRLHARGITDSDREYIETRLASTIGYLHPEDTLWAMDLMLYGGEKLAAASASKLAEESPEKAFEYASDFPPAYHEVAANAIIPPWYERDSEGASAFILTMEPGDLRYHAAVSLANRLQRTGNETEAEHWHKWAEESEKQ